MIHVTTVTNINIHHTSLSVNITDKVDGNKIANATATLSNSKKVGTSDANGELSIDEVMNGDTTLTIKADGYKDYTQQLKITSGKNNHVEVGMEKM